MSEDVQQIVEKKPDDDSETTRLRWPMCLGGIMMSLERESYLQKNLRYVGTCIGAHPSMKALPKQRMACEAAGPSSGCSHGGANDADGRDISLSTSDSAYIAVSHRPASHRPVLQFTTSDSGGARAQLSRHGGAYCALRAIQRGRSSVVLGRQTSL